VETFNKLKQNGNLHRNACVFNWAWQTLTIIQKTFKGLIDSQQLPDVIVADADEFRAFMISIVTLCAEDMRESLHEGTKNLYCDEHCPEEAYDGSDFLSITTADGPPKGKEQQPSGNDNNNDDDDEDDDGYEHDAGDEHDAVDDHDHGDDNEE